MRIGLAGAGRIGALHAQTLAGLPEVTGLVVADVDQGRARALAERLGGEAVATPDDLYAAGLDGLVVAAATEAHAALVLGAVDAGIPVFCEKPVASDVAGTVAVVDKVRAGDVAVQIGFQRRFDAGYVAARDAVASGELGFVHTLRSTTMDPAPPPAAYVATSGGLFRDCSVHDFDSVRWVSGQEVEEVYAVGANRGADYFAAAGDVDVAAVVLTLTDGTFALVSATRYNARGYDVRLEVHGSQDSIAAGLDDHLALRSVEPGATFPAGPTHPAFLDRFLGAYRAELAAFTDVVAGRDLPACTVDDALEAFSVAEACELSRREHRPVQVAEVRR